MSSVATYTVSHILHVTYRPLSEIYFVQSVDKLLYQRVLVSTSMRFYSTFYKFFSLSSAISCLEGNFETFLRTYEVIIEYYSGIYIAYTFCYLAVARLLVINNLK